MSMCSTCLTFSSSAFAQLEARTTISFQRSSRDCSQPFLWWLSFLVSRWGWNCAPDLSRPEGCNLNAEGLTNSACVVDASCVLRSPGRFGPLRAEVVVGLRRLRLVQELLSSPLSAGLVLFSVGLPFLFFLLPFRVARFGLGFMCWCLLFPSSCVNHLERCRTSNSAEGSDRVCGITANEDAHILWWCIGRRPDVYLQNSVWTVEQAVHFRGFTFFSACTVFAIWITRLRQMQQLHLART